MRPEPPFIGRRRRGFKLNIWTERAVKRCRIHLANALSFRRRSVRRAEPNELDGRMVADYADKTTKTLSRDIKALVHRKMIRRVDDG